MSKPGIIVLDGHTLNPGDNPWDPIAALGQLTAYENSTAADVVQRAGNAEIILTNKTPLSAEIMADLPRLRYIGVLATGYNVVDIQAASKHGITVTNVPEYSTDSVAQFVFALILNHCHNVQRHSDAVKAGRWQAAGHFCFWDYPLIELAGKTIGIVGFGRIGRAVAALAGAFGMKVLADSRTRKDPPAGYPFAWCGREELFSKADYVSLHCPLTEETTGMVDASLLAKMKASAFLVNTGRGPLINEQDLADALNAGRLAGAACDVTVYEPINGDSPLLSASNITITPHIAWATLEARQRLMKTAAINIESFLNDNPVNVVNAPGS